jgi:excisionase family DNA binding protein
MKKPRSSSAPTEKPDTYSVPEAGRRVDLGKNASYEAARRGELPVLRFGRKLRVPRVAFERLLAHPVETPDSVSDIARPRTAARRVRTKGVE